MQHSTDFLQDLAVVMMVAALMTIIFHRLKQPLVLGYILAGFIIGPYTPPFPLIKDQNTIRTLGELGVVFLMFSLGLEFSFRKLKQVGTTAVIAAILEILLMVLVGYEIGQAFGWKIMDSVFLGAMLSISSTTIIAKALANLGKSKERFSEIIFGILIVEDILAIVMIALLSGMAMTGSLETSGVIMTMGRLGVFLVVAVVLGLLAVPRLLGYVARFQSNEMLLITVLGLCFGVSLLAVKLNYNVALGAFIIGAVIAEARQIARIEVLMAPIRDMFSAVFFVTIGLQIDPRLLAQHALPAFVITAAVVIGKVVSCAFGTFVAGHTTRTSLRVGMGLAQIGEFSFIIASLGLTLKVTSDFLYPIAVTVSLITTLLTPYLIQSADGLVAWFDRVAPPTFVKYLQLYTGWVSQLGGRRKDNLGGRLIRKWVWQMGLNLTLIAGVFLAAAFLAQGSPRWLPRVYESAESMKALLWLCAMLLSLPLLIATFRKLQALGILLSEMSVNFDAAGARVASYRAIVSHAIPVAGLMGMGLLILLLSSTLLPPLKVLILLGLVVVLIAFLLWRSLIKLYSKAQIALHETFAQPPPPRREDEPKPLFGLLKETQLEIVPISPTSPAAGKLIREIQLRTLTGATIVAIERVAGNIINPGPEEEVLAGDQLLLLGNREQLSRGRLLLAGVPPSP